MDETLKQRLVGAAVLVALVVIFVPMVLDGPDQPAASTPTTVTAASAGASTFRYDLNAPLPATGATMAAPMAIAAATAAAPAAAAHPASAPNSVGSKPAPVAARPTAKSTATPEPSKPATKPAVATASATSNGWAAQVGSFSKQATADGVGADLKAKGFKAFVMPHKDGNQTLYRVRVGPVASREAADALAKKITAATGQAARPVPHP